MSLIYTLETHLKYPHLKFALTHGTHYQDFPSHCHDFSELFIVVKGTATHTVADHRYPLSQGDVFVINGQVEHGFTNVDELVLINLMFESHLPLFENSSLKLLPGYQALFTIEPLARQQADYTAKLNLNSNQYAEVERIVQTIDDEYSNGQTGFETMLTATLQQLVITLARFYQGDNVQMNSSTMILSRALVYLEEHFRRDDLRTEQIANASYVSTRQLERLFRLYLQTTPNKYIKDKRLNYAYQQLVSDSELTIQQIADQAGYSDSNYFSKCFKAQFGQNPSQYRKDKTSEPVFIV
ncbi:helix-turn-helix domain-containing protein [Vibrio sp. MA40-2]|uniref:helix-turn-helix domain-containing protein n=1 Tax=Vibrio sp. MA40-2 TaxID=3391828 RepID=UPI0039A50210